MFPIGTSRCSGRSRSRYSGGASILTLATLRLTKRLS